MSRGKSLAPRGERARNRAAEWLDFNTVPSLARVAAAHGIKRDELETLLSRLEAADDAMSAKPDYPRPAAIDALQAAVDFIAGNPYDADGRFSRPLARLLAELSALGKGAPAGSILPPFQAGPGGANRRGSTQRLKAAAAFAVELLHRRGTTVEAAARQVAAVLGAQGFSFGARSADKGKAVERWRRDFSRGARQRPTEHYQRFLMNPPIEAECDAKAVIAWLELELEKAGYE